MHNFSNSFHAEAVDRSGGASGKNVFVRVRGREGIAERKESNVDHGSAAEFTNTGTAFSGAELATPYLRAVLGFMGIYGL